MSYRLVISLKFIAVFIFAGFVGGCSSLEVNSDYDRDADFSTYSTYSWLDQPDAARGNQANDLVIRRIESAIDNQLQLAGLTKSMGTGDLGIVWHGSSEERTSTSVDTYGYGGAGWGYGYNGWWGGGMGTTVVSHNTYDEGMLIIDLIDTKENQLVFRSVATAVLGSQSGTQEFIDKVVAKMIGKYPGQ